MSLIERIPRNSVTMEIILKKAVVCAGFFLHFVAIVHCDAYFELKLLSFSNPSGRESDGDCCESIFGFGSCSSSYQCDPILRICIESNCYWTDEYENQNSFSFGSFTGGKKNPHKVYYTTWPGSARVSIRVEDVDDGSNDFMGEKTQTFSQWSGKNDALTLWNDFTFTWNFNHNHGSHTMTVRAQARVYCARYYYGNKCDKMCFPRDTDEHGHFTCSDTGDKICMENYHGDSCKVFCKPQDTDSGHYSCGENGQKICHAGWDGANCDLDVDECIRDEPCSPNGNCTNLAGPSYVCDCVAEYTGTNCDEVKQFCDDKPCSNHSVCNNTFGGYDCICEDFWRGRHCDEPPYCNFNPCSNTSVCNNTEDGYVCLCDPGWQGQNCTEKITPCTNNPCLNAGICSVEGDTYNCTCVGSWEGKECQTIIREIFTDNRTMVFVGYLTSDKEEDLQKGIYGIMIDMGFHNTTVDTKSSYNNNEHKSTVTITVSSHDPRIKGVLEGVPDDILKEILPLPLFNKGNDEEPSAQPVIAPKTSPWVKTHWYAILLIVLALVTIIAGLVIFMFVMKKRRSEKLKQSGFDHDVSVQQVNGSVPDAAAGFDNNLYWEIRDPDTVGGLPNGKY